MHAICIHEHGGPEALRYEEVSTSEPGASEARVRIEAAGLNYIDVYHRTGLYPSTNLPFTPGMEGAGVVEAVGPMSLKSVWAIVWVMRCTKVPTPRRNRAVRGACPFARFDRYTVGCGSDAARYDGRIT